MIVGVISDTHGLLRPEVFEAFQGVDLILHAGDVGGRGILGELGRMAPVHAVRGNIDDPSEPGLSGAVELTLDAFSVHVSHGHELGQPTPERLLAAYAADILVYGHTHRPLVERAGKRLVVNPGAAGPRRFDLKPSVAVMVLAGADANVRLISL